MESRYRTKDLYVAALLYASRNNFLSIERIGRVCWFIFSDQEKCQSLVDDYWSGKAECNAKHFADALRTLKDMVYSEE